MSMRSSHVKVKKLARKKSTGKGKEVGRKRKEIVTVMSVPGKEKLKTLEGE